MQTTRLGLRPKTAARVADLPVRIIRHAIRTHELPCIEISPRVRLIRPHDLEQWIESRRSAT